MIFRKITLPYMLFVMTPNLITSFTGNINNFNVIFLLSGGGPDSLEYYYAGSYKSAGMFCRIPVVDNMVNGTPIQILMQIMVILA